MTEVITNMLDPTHDEMMAVLEEYPYFNESDAFDWERAIYWFASDWHSGQLSNLYSVLSTSKYKPGALENCIDPASEAHELYVELEEAFAT